MLLGTLEDAAFPQLSDEQMEAIACCGTARAVRDGETLFEEGQTGFQFYVVQSGAIEIVEHSTGRQQRVTVHRPREFTGDVDMLTGRPAVVTAVARGDGRVLEISSADIRRIVSELPEIGDLILRAFIARRQLLIASDFVGCRVIGSRFSPDTFRIRDFLARNGVPFTWIDLENDPSVGALLAEFQVKPEETPVVTCGHSLLLRRPSNRELGARLGVSHALEETLYDLAIVGAGPAGLAAAVYGASEGLNTAVLEGVAPGGQAGCSSKIENYLGFPTGLSGAELTDRATLQAYKFGARLSVPSPAVGLRTEGTYHVVDLEGGGRVAAKCVLIASGAEYCRLGVEGLDRFEGAGVYYSATATEAMLCKGAAVAVVGGGNSAGQAAVFLSEHASKVWLIIRGDDLGKSMSQYLVRRIEGIGNIELLTRTEVRQLSGNGSLAAVEIEGAKSEGRRRLDLRALFTFIGADPRTAWLPAEVEKDPKGFVKTGRAAAGSPRWKLGRAPYLLETTVPGVFAAGDVRQGSTKRVAAAVGEGSMTVQFVHEFLRDS